MRGQTVFQSHQRLPRRRGRARALAGVFGTAARHGSRRLICGHMSKKIQYQGLCVVCSGKRLSDEHVWSDWLSSLLPRGNVLHEAKFSESLIDQVVGARPVFKPVKKWRKIRQGAVHSIKTKRVCIRCNGGWMAAIVDRSKAVATRAITLQFGALTRDDQTRLATWLALSATMRDQSARVGLPKMRSEALRYLWKRQEPPGEFYVGVGAFRGGRSVNNSYNVRLTRSMAPPHEIASMVHSIAVSMGGLFAVVVAPWRVDPDFARILPSLYSDCLTQIWPPHQTSIPWPNYARAVLGGKFGDGEVGTADEVAHRARRAFSYFHPANWVGDNVASDC